MRVLSVFCVLEYEARRSEEPFGRFLIFRRSRGPDGNFSLPVVDYDGAGKNAIRVFVGVGSEIGDRILKISEVPEFGSFRFDDLEFEFLKHLVF